MWTSAFTQVAALSSLSASALHPLLTAPFYRSPIIIAVPGVWNAHFAFAKAETKRPIVLGEIGGMYIGQDKQWQDWALPYMKAQGFGLFYFALNPDSEVRSPTPLFCTYLTPRPPPPGHGWARAQGLERPSQRHRGG